VQEPVAQGSKEHLKIMMEEIAWEGRLELSDALANIDEFYTTPPAQPAPVQPVGTYGEIYESMQSLLRSGLQSDQQIYAAMKDRPLYTTPPAAQRQWVEVEQVKWDGEKFIAKLKEKNT
jgi:hypothetical protein